MWFQCSLRKQTIMMGTGFLSDLMPLLMSHQNQMKKLYSLPWNIFIYLYFLFFSQWLSLVVTYLGVPAPKHQDFLWGFLWGSAESRLWIWSNLNWKFWSISIIILLTKSSDQWWGERGGCLFATSYFTCTQSAKLSPLCRVTIFLCLL